MVSAQILFQDKLYNQELLKIQFSPSCTDSFQFQPSATPLQLLPSNPGNSRTPINSEMVLALLFINIYGIFNVMSLSGEQTLTNATVSSLQHLKSGLPLTLKQLLSESGRINTNSSSVQNWNYPKTRFFVHFVSFSNIRASKTLCSQQQLPTLPGRFDRTHSGQRQKFHYPLFIHKQILHCN